MNITAVVIFESSVAHMTGGRHIWLMFDLDMSQGISPVVEFTATSYATENISVFKNSTL